MIQYTRQDYLNSICSHEEYYAQFVNSSVKQRVKNSLDKELKSSKKTSDIPLSTWDTISIPVNAESAKLLKEAGDYPTLAGAVCIFKEAARQMYGIK